MKNDQNLKQKSDFTGDDLAVAKLRLDQAQAVYDEWLPTVQRWQKDKYGWFRRKKRSWWHGVLASLEKAKEDYRFILEGMSHEQNIDLVDQSAYMAANPEAKPFPWKTVGLVAAGLVLIIIFYKVV